MVRGAIADNLAPTENYLPVGAGPRSIIEDQPSGLNINTANGGKFSTSDNACP